MLMKLSKVAIMKASPWKTIGFFWAKYIVMVFSVMYTIGEGPKLDA